MNNDSHSSRLFKFQYFLMHLTSWATDVISYCMFYNSFSMYVKSKTPWILADSAKYSQGPNGCLPLFFCPHSWSPGCWWLHWPSPHPAAHLSLTWVPSPRTQPLSPTLPPTRSSQVRQVSSTSHCLNGMLPRSWQIKQTAQVFTGRAQCLGSFWAVQTAPSSICDLLSWTLLMWATFLSG